MSNAVEVLENFLGLLNTLDKNWDSAYSEVGKADKETQDLLHELELTKFNAYEGFQLAQKLKEVRQTRRENKDWQEVNRPLRDYLEQNKTLKVTLYKVLHQMKQAQAGLEERSYKPRILTDMKLAKQQVQQAQQQTEQDQLLINIG